MRSYSQAYFSGGEHLAGLGDAFVMSPIVHKISKDYDKIYAMVSQIRKRRGK